MDLQYVPCMYTYAKDFSAYTCKVYDETITHETDLKFQGKHQKSRKNSHIHRIEFLECEILYLPKLKDSFINLKQLQISESKLKMITRDDLLHFPNLTMLDCPYNELTFIPGDLFANTTKIEVISFCHNKLIAIDPSVLVGLNFLTYVDFCENPCINLCYDMSWCYCANSTLENVKKTLEENYANLSMAVKTKYSIKRENDDQSLEAHNQKEECTPVQCIELPPSKRSETIPHRIDSVATVVLKRLDQIYDDADIVQNGLNPNETSVKKIISSPKRLNQSDEPNVMQNGLNQSDDDADIVHKNDVPIWNDVALMLKVDAYKDFTVIVRDRKMFKVHKIILAARSKFFADYFVENKEETSIELNISVEVFRIIENYVYQDELPNKIHALVNFAELFRAASKFQLERLKEFAARKLLDKVNAENCVRMFKLGFKYNNDLLRKRSLEEVEKQFPAKKFKENSEISPEMIEELVNLKRKTDQRINEIFL